MQDMKRYPFPSATGVTVQGHSYRLYIYGAKGDLLGPATVLSVANDDAAIAEASKRLDGHAAELRDELRLVMKFERK
jgi:hypothetical protein